MTETWPSLQWRIAREGRRNRVALQ